MNNRSATRNSGSDSQKQKIKATPKGWTRSLKTWLAWEKVKGGMGAGVYRRELRQHKVGCFLEQTGLVNLDKNLRGSQAWWASRGR